MKKLMQKAIFSLLVLGTIGIVWASNETPIISVSPTTMSGIEPNVEFTFSIVYRYTDRLYINSNNLSGDVYIDIPEDNKDVSDCNVAQFTSKITTANTVVIYVVNAENDIDNGETLHSLRWVTCQTKATSSVN